MLPSSLKNLRLCPAMQAAVPLFRLQSPNTRGKREKKEQRHEHRPRAGRPFPSPMATAGGAALAALALLVLLSFAAASDSDHKVGAPPRPTRPPQHLSALLARSEEREHYTLVGNQSSLWCRTTRSRC